MDEELKKHLQGMEDRTSSLIAREVGTMANRILHEMGTRFDEMNTRLESIDSRLKLQAGLIQAGSRAIARFSEFSENAEERWVGLTKRVAALEKKVGLNG